MFTVYKVQLDFIEKGTIFQNDTQGTILAEKWLNEYPESSSKS